MKVWNKKHSTIKTQNSSIYFSHSFKNLTLKVHLVLRMSGIHKRIPNKINFASTKKLIPHIKINIKNDIFVINNKKYMFFEWFSEAVFNWNIKKYKCTWEFATIFRFLSWLFVRASGHIRQHKSQIICLSQCTRGYVVYITYDLKVIYHPIYSMNNFVINKSKLPQVGAQVFPYMGWLVIMWPSERVTC